MKKYKVLGLAGMLIVFAMALCSCGSEGGDAQEAPSAALADELYYGYSIGVPEYYSDNGFVLNEGNKYNDKVSKIDDQAVLQLINKSCELKAEEFGSKAMEEFSIMTGWDTTDMTAEEAEISGLPGIRVTGTDAEGNEMKAVVFLNEDYQYVTAITVKEFNNDAEKEHAYLDDFELIPDAIQPIGPEEHMAKLGYTIDFPDYYEKFVPFDMGMETGYACYSNSDVNLDMTIIADAGEDSLDKNDTDLEESLKFDDQTGVNISRSDEVVKGSAKIRQYSYSYSGLPVGGAGALIYDTEKDVLININLMQSGKGDADYVGDFNKMIEEIEVE